MPELFCASAFAWRDWSGCRADGTFETGSLPRGEATETVNADGCEIGDGDNPLVDGSRRREPRCFVGLCDCSNCSVGTALKLPASS